MKHIVLSALLKVPQQIGIFCLFEVLAMAKQLGLPTYFMTLSCADLRWNELPSIISKLKGLNLLEEETS